nr:probable inactive tRNA-specific adenosine deaminase-like protein 3 [Pocillopora verrucosa]
MASDLSLEPAEKKARLNNISEGLLENMKEGVTFPRPVLANEYTRDFQTVQVYAADVTDKTQTSQLIRDLNEILPLKELGHLRRVRCHKVNDESLLQIILFVRNEVTADNSFTQLIQQNKTAANFLGEPFVANVAKHPPLTREQFNQASLLWPVNFHEDKYVSRALKGELFNKDEVALIEKFMRMAIVETQNMTSRKFPIGAVIVDPQKNQPIAVCHDLRCAGHPLQHAVMVCLDLVAHSQSSGAWKLDCQEVNETWKLKEKGSQLQQRTCCFCSKNDSKDCSPMEKGSVGERFIHYGELCNSLKNADNKCKSLPYLCTGYDLYVTREPCAMCAMALVHSRIRRVFYGCSDNKTGALGSRYKIHTQTGLNHHYEVFCGVLEDECRALFERTPS